MAKKRYASFNGNKNYIMPLDEAPIEGGVSSNSFLFNRENGGTHQLFQIKPEKFAYKFNVKVRQKKALTNILVSVLPMLMLNFW